MKLYLLSVLLLFAITHKSWAQTGCIDSVSFNRFFPSDFEIPVSVGAAERYYPQRDALDNIYISGLTPANILTKYWSIIKFNANNQVIWYRNYTANGLPFFKPGGDICDIDPNGNLLFSENINFPNPFSYTISKTDNSGNLLWSKIIRHGNNININGGFGNPVINNNGELFTVGGFLDDRENPIIAAFSASGNLNWTKKYSHSSIPKYHLISSTLTVQNSNTLVHATHFFYNADSQADPAVKFGIQLIQINAADGSIIQHRSFMYYTDATGNNARRTYLKKISYDSASRQFLLLSDENNFGRNSAFSFFDENLNHLKTVSYTGDAKVYISKKNEVTIVKTYQGPFVQNFNYATLDNNLNISSQKVINITTLGFPLRNFDIALSNKKNGIFNFQLGTYTNFQSDYLYLFDHSPFYNNISSCLGVDTVVYIPRPIYYFSIPDLAMEEAGTVPLSITDNIPDGPPVDFPLPKTEICKAVSICDTIKLFGTQFHCLSNPFDSFKIFRNPLCVRKTNWQLDTNYIKILGSTDTSLHVQYLRPYRGSIKVGFGGCSLTDEVPIEVYAAQTGVNLGNDTLHCPGKTITLRAGKNFRTYLWQDGSSNDSLIAVQPGVYNVIVTDSCGNVFKDTLTVNPFDGVLQVDYPQELCKNDMVVITLPNNLINYTWQPATNSSLSNYTWNLYPSSTTIYTITGERVPGCALSDTVLVNVKNCPKYVYFPSAFTPNNDGVNDIYKPSVAGNIVFYQLIIYNRYGQTVFTSSSPNEGWNGLFNKSSKPLPGSYVWFCRYKFFNRPEQQEKGTFTLIR